MDVFDFENLRVTRIELPTPFAVGTVNSFLLQLPDKNILVDCGMLYDQAKDALYKGLQACNLAPADIDAVILTHGHVDHIGLTREFRDAGAKIYGHPKVAGWLDKGGQEESHRVRFYQRLYALHGVPSEVSAKAINIHLSLQQWTDRSVVDEYLSEGDTPDILPDFRVLYLPGHSQSSIALWSERRGVLFSGDELLERISSNALIEPMDFTVSIEAAQPTPSLHQQRRGLARMQSMTIPRVFPGHGPSFTEVDVVIARRLRDLERRKSKMLAMVGEAPGMTTYELALRYFPRHSDETSLILSETLGYLEWLLDDGRLTSCVDDERVIRWLPSSTGHEAVKASRDTLASASNCHG